MTDEEWLEKIKDYPSVGMPGRHDYSICLDGYFTLEDLENIIYLLKKFKQSRLA